MDPMTRSSSRAVVLACTVALLTGCGSGDGSPDASATSRSVAPTPTATPSATPTPTPTLDVPPTASPTASPSIVVPPADRARPTTMTGAVTGVADGCILFKDTADGQRWVLVGPLADELVPGRSYAVEGVALDAMDPSCPQGMPFQVGSLSPQG